MFFKIFNSNDKFPISILKQKPVAIASIKGRGDYKELKGEISFLKDENQTIVQIDIFGLEKIKDNDFKYVLISVNSDDYKFFKENLNYFILKTTRKEEIPSFFIEPNDNGKLFACFLTDKISIEQIIGYSVNLFAIPNSFNKELSDVYVKKIANGTIVKT